MSDKKLSMPPISVEDYEYSLMELCHQDTSLDQENWDENNYLRGHCAVVSLQAQKLFGGTLLRTSLENTPYSSMRSHYKNKFNGEEKDFTKDQFNQEFLSDDYKKLNFEPRARKDVLSPKYTNTIDRYVELTFRLHDLIHDKKNPIFADNIYRECISQAVLSPCQKAGFGAILKYDDRLVAGAYNNTIDELAHQCDPNCIRLDIQSRTESMIGACGHAEEWVMKKARDENIPLTKCDIYIAGLDNFGLPWLKENVNHSCIRCAVQMNYANIKGVYVPVKDKWEKLSTSEALKTAEKYALKERKI